MTITEDFVSERLGGGKHFRRDCVFHQYSLNVARAVPHNEELNLAAGSLVVDPAAESDFLAHMLAGCLLI